MARQGTIADNPVTGERIEFLKTARDTNGAVLKFDYSLQPGGFAVGKFDHAHPTQEERFEVRSGSLGVRIDGDEWTATEGTKFAIPPETAHTVWNDGPSEVHARVEIRPALRVEEFLETMYGLAREGKTNSLGLPNPLQLAVIADYYRDELYFARLPRRLQHTVAGVLAPVGRALNYRPRYPLYEGADPADRKPRPK